MLSLFCPDYPRFLLAVAKNELFLCTLRNDTTSICFPDHWHVVSISQNSFSRLIIKPCSSWLLSVGPRALCSKMSIGSLKVRSSLSLRTGLYSHSIPISRRSFIVTLSVPVSIGNDDAFVSGPESKPRHMFRGTFYPGPRRLVQIPLGCHPSVTVEPVHISTRFLSCTQSISPNAA